MNIQRFRRYGFAVRKIFLMLLINLSMSSNGTAGCVSPLAWTAKKNDQNAIFIPEIHTQKLMRGEWPASIERTLEQASAIGLETVYSLGIAAFRKEGGHPYAPLTIISEKELFNLFNVLDFIPKGASESMLSRVRVDKKMAVEIDTWMYGLILYALASQSNDVRDAKKLHSNEYYSISDLARIIVSPDNLLSLDEIEESAEFWKACATPETTRKYIRYAIEDGLRTDAAERINSNDAEVAILSGDVNGLERWVTKRRETGFLNIHDECIVDMRNEKWIQRIESQLSNHKDVVYIVGATHMFGSKGMLAKLVARGYMVNSGGLANDKCNM